MPPLKVGTSNFPLMSVINGAVGSISLTALGTIIWMLSGYANRVENLERNLQDAKLTTERGLLESKTATAEARAQSSQQYATISQKLEAFPLAAEQLTRAVRDIQDLRDTDKDFDRRVRSLENDNNLIIKEWKPRVENELSKLGSPVNLRDTRR